MNKGPPVANDLLLLRAHLPLYFVVVDAAVAPTTIVNSLGPPYSIGFSSLNSFDMLDDYWILIVLSIQQYDRVGHRMASYPYVIISGLSTVKPFIKLIFIVLRSS